jgi:hypothetical protein
MEPLEPILAWSAAVEVPKPSRGYERSPRHHAERAPSKKRSALEKRKLPTEKDSEVGPAAAFIGRAVWDGRTEEGAAGQEHINRGNQVASGAGFGHEASGSHLANLADESSRFVHGEDEERGGKVTAGDFKCDFEAAHARHGYIDDGDIRLKRLYGLKSFMPIGCLGTNFPIRPRALNEDAHTVADNFVIVCYEDFHCHVSPTFFVRWLFDCDRVLWNKLGE